MEKMTPVQEEHERKRKKGGVKVKHTGKDTIVILIDDGSPQVEIRNPTPEEILQLSEYFNGGGITRDLRLRMNYLALGSLGRMKNNADSKRRADWKRGLAQLAH